MESPPPAAILVVRVWFEERAPEGLRARLVEVSRDGAPDRVIGTVASLEDCCLRLREWAEELTGR